MQMAFYFDQTRCTGCYTCQVACKDWHDVPAGPASWMRVATIEKGKYPNPFVAFMCTRCYHCAKPACVAACPVGAITKRKNDGIVVVDREVCVGKNACQACLEACSYKAPQFGAEDNAKIQKCDFCLDRWAEGKQPICVAGCPMRALDAGTIKEMKTKHGDIQQAVGFTFDEKLRPCVVFKPKPEPVAAVCSG
ncbi:MAG: 4Fe-4S dicluster domain-containing protein [Chloroflexi bacterium]|nr:4Fe-4S dicluster domain-containing protein [Chloroflexota bacterium]